MDGPTAAPLFLSSNTLSSLANALQPTKMNSILGVRRASSARPSKTATWNPTDQPRDRLTLSQLFPAQRPGSAPPGVLFPTPASTTPGSSPNSHYTLRDMAVNSLVRPATPSGHTRSSSAGPAITRSSSGGVSSVVNYSVASSPRMRSSSEDPFDSPSQPAGGPAPGPHAPSPPTAVVPPPADIMPTDPVASSLALELEMIRAKLARQTEVATRAEAALQAAALQHQRQQVSLQEAVEELKAEIIITKRTKRDMEAETEVLRMERMQLKAELHRLQEELQADQTALKLDRETLASTIRSHQTNESQLEVEVSQLREENEHLQRKLLHVQRRLDEEVEVVEAVRGQLYEYKQMLGHMQQQAKRGKAAGQAASTGGGGGVGLSRSGDDRPGSAGHGAPGPGSNIGRNMVVTRASSSRTGAPARNVNVNPQGQVVKR